MYPATKTFWIEPAGRYQLHLRRYCSATTGKTCVGKDGYHNAKVYLATTDDNYREDEYGGHWAMPDYEWPSKDDPRWPTKCKACDYRFDDDDPKQEFFQVLYHVPGSSIFMTLQDVPPGAMWDAKWLHHFYEPVDGIVLAVKLPNGHEWIVDSEATNCTRKGDKTHKCWVRHGDPRTGNVTVSKNGPNTCSAGGGSIQSGDYHGFLTNGVLRQVG